MKQIISYIMVFSCLLSLTGGCGKKGDPEVRSFPQPLPVQQLSASVDAQGITLSWQAPDAYENGNELKPGHIKAFRLTRKTEAPVTKGWDFSQTNEGWSASGKTSPLKHHQGVLRTVSTEEKVILRSQDNLALSAATYPYVRFKLRARNAKQGYLAFITTADQIWDIDRDLAFHPAVHTSYAAYKDSFEAVKLISFPISASDAPQDYLLDMRSVGGWTGTIKQIGLVLQNSVPNTTEVDVGLDRIEFVTTREKSASVYENAPWLFLRDAEGWTSPQAERNLFGAAQGVLYAQSPEAFGLFCAPDQKIPVSESLHFNLRMSVSAGDTAYLWLRRTGDASLNEFPDRASLLSSPQIFRIPLRRSSAFETYRIPLGKALAAQTTTMTGAATITQIGLLFPDVPEETKRHILLDSIDIFDSEKKDRSADWTQTSLPSSSELERIMRQERRSSEAGFLLPYAELPEEETQLPVTSVELAEFTPKKPTPATLQDGLFLLRDLGKFVTEDETPAPLDYGTIYTYSLEVIDRKNQSSIESESSEDTEAARKLSSVTVEFFRIPQNPRHLKAKTADERITLTWNRPLLTIDGQKIRRLEGYNVYRSFESGIYPPTPFTRVPATTTTFVDKNVRNGTRYYYAIQSVASLVSGDSNPKLSEEVSAIPQDNVAPSAPKELVGVYLADGVKLYWNQGSATSDFGGFHVYRSASADGEFKRLNAQPVLNASYADDGVETHTRYYYRVTAIDDESIPNESLPSGIVVVDTLPLN